MQKKQFVLFMITLCTINFTAKAQWSLTGNSGTNTTSNFIGTKDNQSLIIRTNNLERMRILNKGFVGIGTATPQALLHIPSKGSVSLSATDNFLLGDTTSQNLAFDFNKIQARNNRKINTLLLNPKGGAVVIGNQTGTANPGLYVDTGGNVGVKGQYIQPGYALTVNPGFTGNGLYLYHPGDGYILRGSKIGQGTAVYLENTSPSNTSPVIWAATEGSGTAIYGFSRGGTYSTGVAGITDGGTNSSGLRGQAFGTGYGVWATGYNSVGLYANSENDYGIYAATKNATYAAYFNKSIFVNGSVFTSSDQKLKQNIQDFNSAMDIINRLQPKKYEYRQDGTFKLMKLPEGVHYGLIAQEVEKVLPNLVKNSKFKTALDNVNNINPDEKGNARLQQDVKSETIDFKAVNYTELIPILIKGLQEQEQKIEQLTTQVDHLLQASSKTDNTIQMDNSAPASKASLQQNTPNPFEASTTIRYYLSPHVSKAAINITDTNGRLVKTYTLTTKGNGQLTITSGTLPSGTYQYTLVADGKITATRKMSILK